MKILLADDEAPILHSTSTLLRHMGFEVVTVSEARDILPLMRRERPQLLLQDVRMPGLDIRVLMRDLQAEPELRDIPVLLFSASITLTALFAEVGARAMLEKPFRPAELRAAIADATAGRPTA